MSGRYHDRGHWTPEVREQERQRNASFYSRNRERRLRAQAEYRERNPVRTRATVGHCHAIYRVRIWRLRRPDFPPQPELTEAQKEECIALRMKAAMLTELMGEPYEVDHIVDLRLGGLEVPENLRILTRREHRRLPRTNLAEKVKETN